MGWRCGGISKLERDCEVNERGSAEEEDASDRDRDPVVMHCGSRHIAMRGCEDMALWYLGLGARPSVQTCKQSEC